MSYVVSPMGTTWTCHQGISVIDTR